MWSGFPRLECTDCTTHIKQFRRKTVEPVPENSLADSCGIPVAILFPDRCGPYLFELSEFGVLLIDGSSAACLWD